jgi:hypothetical protein
VKSQLSEAIAKASSTITAFPAKSSAMGSGIVRLTQRRAVKLAIESDQSVTQTARDLGVNKNTLHTWLAKTIFKVGSDSACVQQTMNMSWLSGYRQSA